MVTIGGGATLQVQQQIASMGSNMLMVSPGKRLGPGQSSGNVPFKEADVEAIMREVGSIAAVAPVSSRSVQAILGNQNWTTQVTGSDNNYFYVTKRTVGQAGSSARASYARDRRRVIANVRRSSSRSGHAG
jgi:putative ABC transport system permease protein